VTRPAASPAPDDFALMDAIAGGDVASFQALSERWRPRLVNFFRGLGADRDGAEDCAQEALLRVYRYRESYRPASPFPSFLFTLARRSFLDWRRKVARFPAQAEETERAGDDGRGTPGERLDLAAAVASLPRRLRQVVDLGAIRGLPYDRVAVLLGIPVGTVKSRMHHAILRLRESLGDAPG
jgi:RNA polymerase sigma-70 factor (ECF subfamily)